MKIETSMTPPRARRCHNRDGRVPRCSATLSSGTVGSGVITSRVSDIYFPHLLVLLFRDAFPSNQSYSAVIGFSLESYERFLIFFMDDVRKRIGVGHARAPRAAIGGRR